jgi:hypothetical protein
MKREWPHYRETALPTSFVRPVADDELKLGRAFSATGQRPGRTRKISVIKKTSRSPSTNPAGQKIRHILIFDNHPDSLRLVFGRRGNADVDLSAPPRASSSELIIVSLLTLAALVGMFWPIL